MKNRKRLKIGVVLIGCVVAAVFVWAGRALPGYADRAVRERLSGFEAFDFRYEKLTVSLLAGVRLAGFSVEEKGAGGLACHVRTVDIRPSVVSMLAGRPEVKELIFAGPSCEMAISCDRRCEYPRPFERAEERSGKAAGLPGIEVLNGKLSVNVSQSGRVFNLLLVGLNVETAGAPGGVRGHVSAHRIRSRGVTMRDAIAGFSFRDGKFHLKGFRGKVSRGRVSAIMTLDSSRQGGPYELKATLRKVPASAAARLFGLREGLLRGRVTGTVRSEGTVAGLLESNWRAKLRMPGVSLKVPLRFDGAEPDEKDYLVMKRVRVELEGRGEGGEMVLNASAVNRWADFRLENSKFSFRDFLDGKAEPGVGFDVVVSGTVDRVKKIADGVAGFDIPFNGKMSTHVALAGNSSRPEQLLAKGMVVFSDGVIFQTVSTDPSERERRKIAYDKMEMDYGYKDGVLRVENVVIRGGEIDFSANGYVKVGGRMDVRGDAELSPALAARVLGWEPAESTTEPDDAVRARFRLAGTTNLPLVYWEPVLKPPAAVAAAAEEGEAEPEDMKDKNVLEKIRGLFDKVF